MLYANTDDGSSALWVLDGNGVVVDNIAIYGAERAPILAQINEHYGTSFTGWSDNEIGLRYGDSLPNWSAYEKILLPEMVNFRFLASGNTANITGFMQGDKAYLNAQKETEIWNVSPEGQVWGSGGQASNYEEQTKTLLLSNFGRQISEVLPFVVEWQQGSQVPNWESYTLLS